MKRGVLYYILVLFALVSYGQSVETSEIDSCGVCHVKTSSRSFVIGNKKFDTGLFCLADNSKSWAIVMLPNEKFSTDVEMLMRLGNDELIHLHAFRIEGKIQKKGYISYVYGDIIWTEPYNHEEKYTKLYFYVTEEQLDKIKKSGIRKLRISDGSKFYDKKFGFNELGLYLEKCYHLINSNLKQLRQERKEITEGF